MQNRVSAGPPQIIAADFHPSDLITSRCDCHEMKNAGLCVPFFSTADGCRSNVSCGAAFFAGATAAAAPPAVMMAAVVRMPAAAQAAGLVMPAFTKAAVTFSCCAVSKGGLAIVVAGIV